MVERMPSRLIIAYSLMAVLLAFAIGLVLYYMKKYRARQRLLRGGVRRRRHH